MVKMAFTARASSLASSIVTKFKSPTRRFILLLLVIVWINAINFFVFHHRHKALTYLTNKFNQLNPLNNYEGHAIPKKLVDSITVKFWLNEAKIVSDPRRIEIHSSNYDDLFTKHPLEEVLQLSFSDRCDAFFKNLYVASDSNWVMDTPNRYKMDMEYEMSWDDYKKKYEEITRKRIGLAQNKEPDKVDGKDVHKAIAKVYDGLKDKAKKNEKEMQEQLAYGRIFSKCYVNRDDPKSKSRSDRFAASQARSVGRFSSGRFTETDKERELSANKFPDCADLEARVYPWLSYQFPVYERFSGNIVKSPPHMSDYVKGASESDSESERGGKPVRSKLTGNRACWLNVYKNKLNGKGIVIPFHPTYIDQTVSLIRVLRALKNKLPIQILSYGQLEETQKQKLSDSAREPFVDLPPSFTKVAEHIGESMLENEEVGLTQQELWFVDASSVLVPEAKDRWEDYPLSILATFASSFEEALLMDPTIVPLKNPEYFFNLKEYKNTGAYFYRAKPMHNRKEKNIDFFNKMSPSLVDTVMFNIPILTETSLSLPFFEGLQEMQDSGVAVINKARHFGALSTLLQLGAYWPASYRGSIAQELWLGFIVAGDEDFHFNKYLPAALGDEPPEEEKAPQVCSVHTGHLDPESTNQLAWMTGGFAVCPIENPDVSDDFGNAFTAKTFEDPEDMVEYYKSRFSLRVAIVPPFEDTRSFDLKNDDGNPVSPWQVGQGCSGLVLCANGEIGGSTKHGPNIQKGQFIEFDPLESNLNAFYGDIWMG
ncbi:hypothetical protein FT663_04770 [Candidozyma haemuli var. vulneris]|nr:hypothetical protein FT663_04770 [[Candida] haemuloni var. vulneris]